MSSPNIADNYEKVRDLFAAAFDLAPEKRAEFLRATNEDAAVISEVQSLLDSCAAAGDFLNEVSAAESVRNSLERSGRFVGQTIDEYRIEREIGRGGMGIVFLAVREDFHHQVAIKLIKRGMDSDAILDRFRREREILAALNHPFIARLTDGGTTQEGVHFFVMEYVEGIPVDEFCEKNRLSKKEILRLFQRICEAVSFAHHKLIIHCDLKPTNILVTADNIPKLLDFGIAKLLDSSSDATQTNLRALTPAYASPEQIRGEIVGTTADVYSLGKVLTEVLQITNHEPRTTDHELQIILAKSLREDSTRRYQSVEQFSEDIRRYLNGLPITARRDSVSYRVSKFVQRNKLAVAITVLLILSLIGGLTATLWQFRQARIERARAEQRFNDVRALVNTFLSELNAELQKISGTTPARKLLIQHTLEYLDNASREAGDDAALQRELATAYIKVGDIQGNAFYQNLGDTSGALDSYQKSLEIRQKLLLENPSDLKIKRELAECYESIGDVIWDTGDLPAAFENYQKAVGILEEITTVAPDDGDAKLYLARLYTSLADVKYSEGFQNLRDLSGAFAENEKALAIREALYNAHPDDAKIGNYLKQSYSRLNALYRLAGDFPHSLTLLEKTQVLNEKFLAQDPNNQNRRRDAAHYYAKFAVAFTDSAEFDKALNAAQKSFALREELGNADKTDARAQRDYAYGCSTIGKVLFEKGEAHKALEYFRRQLKIYEDLTALDASNKDKQRNLIDALINVGNALLKTNDSENALAQFVRALEISKRFSADDLEAQSNLASIYDGVGSALMQSGKFAEAAEKFEKSAELRESETQNDKLNVIARAELAKIYFKNGAANEKQSDREAARNWYRKSLDVWNSLREQNALRKIDEQKLEDASIALTRLKLST